MYAEASRRNILKLAKAYASATNRAPTMISMSFYGNGTFFRDLELRKRSISVERLGKLLFDFAKNWPEGAPWPDLEPIYFTKENMLQQHYVRRWHESGKTNHAAKKR